MTWLVSHMVCLGDAQGTHTCGGQVLPMTLGHHVVTQPKHAQIGCVVKGCVAYIGKCVAYAAHLAALLPMGGYYMHTPNMPHGNPNKACNLVR